MSKFVKDVVNYTCKNTEQLGILVERSMCDIASIPFNTKRKYDSISKNVTDDINNSIGGILKKMKLEHAGHLNTTYDFIRRDTNVDRTVSVKTIMSGNKICPQSIGQCSLTSLNKKLDLQLDSKDEFKRYFFNNRRYLLEKYLANNFCCDTLVIYKFQKGLVYIIEKLDNPVLNSKLQISTSKQIDNWNESNTIYISKETDEKKMSLGEMQIHNNRDCIKFRFNTDTLINLIESGFINNLNIFVYDLKSKYNFTVEKKTKAVTLDKMKTNLCFQSFNYIGSKMKLLDYIESRIVEYTGKPIEKLSGFADIFSGTGVVSFHMMKRGCKRILTNDIQNYAYVVSSAWTTNDMDLEKVRGIILELNEETNKLTQIDASETNFICNNYTEYGEAKRMYLTQLNGYKVDKIRQRLNEMKLSGNVTDREFNLLVKILLYAVTRVSNIASVYGAYLKKYKACALKPIVLDVNLLDLLVTQKVDHVAFNMDVAKLPNLSEYEVTYLDPPYVANRSYHDNYHLLETISRYDSPEIRGKTGLRESASTKSKFCSKRDALNEFKSILNKIKSKYIFISYSSESIVSKDKMIEMLNESWVNVVCYEKDYQRFKSNKNSEETQSRNVVEYVFCGRKK